MSNGVADYINNQLQTVNNDSKIEDYVDLLYFISSFKHYKQIYNHLNQCIVQLVQISINFPNIQLSSLSLLGSLATSSPVLADRILTFPGLFDYLLSTVNSENKGIVSCICELFAHCLECLDSISSEILEPILLYSNAILCVKDPEIFEPASLIYRKSAHLKLNNVSISRFALDSGAAAVFFEFFDMSCSFWDKCQCAASLCELISESEKDELNDFINLGFLDFLDSYFEPMSEEIPSALLNAISNIVNIAIAEGIDEWKDAIYGNEVIIENIHELAPSDLSEAMNRLPDDSYEFVAYEILSKELY